MSVRSEHLRNGERAEKRSRAALPSSAIANAVALTLWGALWILNGASTALPFVLLGQRFGALGVWLGIGVCVHIVVSLVENHLWRSFRRCSRAEKAAVATEIFVVGFADVLTTTCALLALFWYLGLASPGLTWYAICTLLAEVIAIGAELMIRLHWRLMRT